MTKAERRVIEVVLAEIHERGRCVLLIAEMSKRAGVSRSTTSLAIRQARKAGDLLVWHRQEQGLSNVIKVPPVSSAARR